MKFLNTFLFLIFSLHGTILNGQLEGSYTIGSANSDFTTINEALIRLFSEGVNDTVRFEILPGEYEGRIQINSQIPNISTTKPVIFESLDKNAESVLLQSSDEFTIQLSLQYHIIFRHLTIKNYRDKVNTYPVHITKSSDIKFENCLVSLECKDISQTGSRAAIYIRLSSGNLSLPGIIFDSCLISGNGCGLTLSGVDDKILISNSLFDHLGKKSLDGSYLKNVTFKNNIFHGIVEIFFTNSIEFHDNEVWGEAELGSGRFTGNIFHQPSYLTGSFVARNVFMYTTSCNVGSMLENTFYGSIRASHRSNIFFEKNICFDEFNLNFCPDSYINANIFYRGAHLGFCDNSIVSNCLLNEELRIGISPNCGVYHNNFGSSARLRFGSWNGEVINNNFSQEIYVENAFKIITNNNYYPNGGRYDSNPFSIPPIYFDTSGLIATNPLLIGKALELNQVKKDFNFQLRSPGFTIGANEICINEDSVEITCGEKILLLLCGQPANGKFHWSPVTGLNNPNSRNPLASVESNIQYIVYDSLSGYSDTVSLISYAINNTIIDTAYSILCGQSIMINTLSHGNAKWNWTPNVGLSSDSIRNPIAQPLSTTTYYLEVEVPGCVDFKDSVLVTVDTLPRAFAAFTNEGPVYSFENNSYCADHFFWSFGDNSFSAEFEPIHEYLNNGVYTIQLIAYNSFGSDTISGNILVSEIVAVDNLIEPSLYIYPNPAQDYTEVITSSFNTKLKIIKLFDARGRLIKNFENFSLDRQVKLSLDNLASGFYICHFIFENGRMIAKPLIIQK